VWRRPEPVGLPDAATDPVVRADLRALAKSNRRSRASIIDTGSPVAVTMTTYGKRIRSVHLAIESIARGTVLPGRIVLWLDDPTLRIPRGLRRLQRRGLEIELVEHGFRVHTKYYPYVRSIAAHVVPVVTSDDDILYPPDWLKGLVDASARHPESVIAYRAHTITLTADGMGSYGAWRHCETTEPGFRHFGTSVSGQLFPPAFLDFVREQGEGFRATTPNADDIWLHHLTLAAGTTTAQIHDRPQHFAFIPGTQSTGLYLSNAWAGDNDVQIAATYTAADIDRMRADTVDADQSLVSSEHANPHSGE
jgi:hypothetical protein